MPRAVCWWRRLALYNLDIRFAAGNEAILPMGLILSLSTVAVLLATPSRGLGPHVSLSDAVHIRGVGEAVRPSG